MLEELCSLYMFKQRPGDQVWRRSGGVLDSTGSGREAVLDLANSEGA